MPSDSMTRACGTRPTAVAFGARPVHCTLFPRRLRHPSGGGGVIDRGNLLDSVSTAPNAPTLAASTETHDAESKLPTPTPITTPLPAEIRARPEWN
jgi:hypothetical protein